MEDSISVIKLELMLYLYKFTAKVPKGVPIAFATNSLGDGNKQGWITDNKGIGSYKEYVYKVQCGTSGSFSSTGFFYLNGGTAPITWYLASATVYDLSDVGDLTGELSSLFANGAVLNTVSTITDKNGFTVKNGAITIRDVNNNIALQARTDGGLELSTIGMKGKLWFSNGSNREPYMEMLGQNSTSKLTFRNSGYAFYGSEYGTEIFDVNMNVNITGDSTTSGTIKAKAFTFGTIGDNMNEAPWYGWGKTNIGSNGGWYGQLANYHGLRLRTRGGILDIPYEGDMAYNRGAVFNGFITTNKQLRVDAEYPYLDLRSPTGVRRGYIGFGNGTEGWMFITADVSKYVSVSAHLVPTSTNTYWLGTNNPNNRWKGLCAEGGTVGASDAKFKENIERLGGAQVLYNESTGRVIESYQRAYRGRATGVDYYNFFRDEFKPTYYNYKLSNARNVDGSSTINPHEEMKMLKNIGFIAQDYGDNNKVAKEFIFRNEIGELSYNHMSYVTAGFVALQEAIKKIEILENRIKALEAS